MSDDKTDLTKLQHSDIEEPGPADVVTQELAYLKPPIHHPHPQPHLGVPEQETKGDTTYVTTCPGIFSELDPFCYPPGTNNLPTIYTNVFDSSGKEIPHTLPSTPQEPYNLHDGEPDVTKIEPTSPTDDLYETFAHLADTIIGVSAHSYWAKFGDCTQVEVGDTLSGQQIDAAHVKAHLQRAIDILEGNPVPDRVYSGFPLLHYNGPHKIKAVKPIEDGLGKIIGGNVAVHQIWYDSHIESDTAFLDLSKLKDKNGEWIKDNEGKEVTWTITYTIDVLRRGKDDFAPMTMYFDDPEFQPPKKDCNGNPLLEDEEGGQRQYGVETERGTCKAPLPNVSMDQTFFPIHEGTRTILRVKMAPPKYYNLTYTWGWRMHPPRVQVMENAGKELPPCSGKKLPDYEVDVFGKNPRGSEQGKLNAISKISDLAPEKRMWMAFKEALLLIEDADPDYKKAMGRVSDAWCAYHE